MYLSVRLAVIAAIAAVVTAVLPFPVAGSLVVVNVCLAALVVRDVVRAPHPSSMQVGRSAPAVASIGRRDATSIRLWNPLDRPVEVGIHDAAPPSLGLEPRRLSSRVGPRETVRLAAAMSPTRRGRTQLGPITVRTAGPLRLAGRQERIDLRHDVRVLPALPGRAHVVARLERARQLHVGQRTSAARGGGSDFDSLRDYHPDDEYRRINWIATARAGKPITNTYRDERDQHVVLLLDAGRSMAASVGGITRFERAIDAAFALAELAANAGDRVGMVAFGDRVLAALGSRGGREQPRRMLELLFDLEPVLAAPDYRTAFATTLGRQRRRSLIVLLTELTDAAAMEPLLAAVPALRARHLVVLGAIRDPELSRLAVAPVTDSEAAYTRSAAAEWSWAREDAARRLRSLGVGVEDRDPGDLTAALADRYLSIKAAGTL
jgi:uncharacterized protein (DUF58 family)